MKILLDECVPWPIHQMFGSHICSSVQAHGWSGIRNSELLKRAESEFDLFITADQNISYQQNLAGINLAILEFSTNDLRRIRAARKLIEEVVDKIQAPGFQRLEIP